jgi:hypothetical protein
MLSVGSGPHAGLDSIGFADFSNDVMIWSNKLLRTLLRSDMSYNTIFPTCAYGY